MRRHAPGALRVESKVDHHDCVLFDDADQQQDADGRNQRQILVEQLEHQQRPNGCRWQARQNGQRVHIALVQRPEQHVDHQQRTNYQDQLAALRTLEHGRIAAVARDHRRRQANLLTELFNLRGSVSERCSGRQVERHGNGLQLADVVDGSRPDGALDRREARYRHERASARTHENVVERTLVLLLIGGHFHDDLVAVDRGVDGRHLALTEGAEQRAANGIDRHAQGIGAVAVNFQRGLQALELRIAGHVAEHRVTAHRLLQPVGPLAQLVGLHALQDVLVLRLALAPAELQILDRSHENRDAGHITQFLAQFFDHRLHGGTRLARLQVDEQATCVLGTSAAIERIYCRHVGIVAKHNGHPFLQLHHRQKRGVLGRFGADLDLPDVLFREKSLGHRDEQVAGYHECHQRDQQHRPAPAQRGVERARVAPQNGIEAALERSHHQAGRTFFGVARQKSAGHHRHQGQRHKGRCHDGQGDDDGKLMEQQPNHTGHEKDRDEHRDQRTGDRQDGEPDFTRAAQRRLKRRNSFFNVTHDVFQHHDRIIDNQPNGERQAEQRNVVQRVAERPQQRHRAQQRYRQRQGWYHRGNKAPQKQKDHQHDQHDGAQHCQGHVVQRVAD